VRELQLVQDLTVEGALHPNAPRQAAEPDVPRTIDRVAPDAGEARSDQVGEEALGDAAAVELDERRPADDAFTWHRDGLPAPRPVGPGGHVPAPQAQRQVERQRSSYVALVAALADLAQQGRVDQPAGVRGAIAAFVVAWALVFGQLALGHDPALSHSKTAQKQKTTKKSTAGSSSTNAQTQDQTQTQTPAPVTTSQS